MINLAGGYWRRDAGVPTAGPGGVRGNSGAKALAAAPDEPPPPDDPSTNASFFPAARPPRPPDLAVSTARTVR